MQLTELETTTATLLSQVRQYAAYTLWANKHLVEWLQTKPQDCLQQYVPSSFPTIRETLLHIWDVQRFWFETMLDAPHEKPFKEAGYSGTLQDVFNGLLSNSADLLAYINTLDEELLSKGHSFIIPNIVLANPATYAILQQITVHGAYHRGQLVTIGRNVGLTDAPMTDYMFYCLMVKKEDTLA